MALREEHDYQRLFDAAVEMREDGDREDAAALFKTMLAHFPGDTNVITEYVRTLVALKDFGPADAELHRALERDPDNHHLRELWATLPFHGCNWNDQIMRDEIFRARLPDTQKHLAKQSIIYTLAAFWESGRWGKAAVYVNANRAAFLDDPDIFGMGVQILGLIGRLDELKALVADAPPHAWSHLPPDGATNIAQRLQDAEANRALTVSGGVRLVSLGQHCLPYQLGTRWGFSPGPVRAEDMTPFDLGAFGANSAADAIATDFAAFAERETFKIIPNWGGGTMYRHAGAGVHFHHERGPHFMENGGANFFARWERMLANWRAASAGGRRLFVFCLVGDGDVAHLVDTAIKHLLTRGARLLVINVLKEPREGPRHKQVTYLHAPYPDDYFWVELHNHASRRGHDFELRIAQTIRTQLVELAAEPDLDDAAYADYRRLLDRALDAIEDAEPEDAAAILTQLLRRHPGDVEATTAYARACRALGQAADADPYLETAIAAHPGHFQLRKTWVDLPAAAQNWAESINRARLLRRDFPPPSYPEAWNTLEIEYDFLYDTGQWDVLERLVEENWDNYRRYPAALPGALGALNNLFATAKLSRLLDEAEPQSWAHLPPEAAINLRVRAGVAAQNVALIERTGVAVVSIGQNCLPYLVGGRWGLLGPAADEKKLNPFELGGFHGENVADALAGDFAAFRDRDAYVVTPAFGGGKMFTHQPSNVGFFHERGPWWMNDTSRFFGRIDMMLGNWETIKTTPKRLFVFCFCGAGNLDRLVEVIDPLLGPDSHLLIVDVLQTPHAAPPHPYVAYVHIPYPRDYTWTNVRHQNATAGIAFELGIMTPIAEALAHWDAVPLTTTAAARAASIAAAAQASRAAGLRENAEVLEAAALCQYPADAAQALANARALRDTARLAEADALLTRSHSRFPDDFHFQKSWAESPIHDANWDEAITRGAALRAAFPAHPDAFFSLNAELAAFYDAGRWQDAVNFLHQHWREFTTRPELFGNALDMLGKLFRHHGAHDLMDAADPAALRHFDAQARDSLARITEAAAENQKRLRVGGARVISLGHNAYPYILAGRWGLNAGPARFDALTPFDIGGFSTAAMAAAIASDFSGFNYHGDFEETPAWFGGQMLVHKPTGINFLSHRRATWTHRDRDHFFEHWQKMTDNWRRQQTGRRIYLVSITHDADPAALLRFFADHLAGDTHLVVLDDAQDRAAAFSAPRVTYIHAAPAEHYHWPRLTGVAHPLHLAYEQRIVGAITPLL